MRYTDQPYMVEYAVTMQGWCRACRKIIEKDELKICPIVQCKRYDGPEYSWHHEKCFFSKFRPKTTAEFIHFDNIRWEDQSLIQNKIDKPPGLVEQPFGDFEIGYINGRQGKCSGCIKEIEQINNIRVSKKDYESSDAIFQGVKTHWYHLDCFVLLRKQLEFLESGVKLPGFENLKENDQRCIKKKLPDIVLNLPTGTPSKQMKREDDNSDNTGDRRQQNEEFWLYRDELSSLKQSEIELLLEENNQELPKGKWCSSLQIILQSGKTIVRLDVLADAMTFGALHRCKKIRQQSICDGQLVYQSGLGYKCINAREWGQCNEIIKNPKRNAFIVPDALKKHPFLNEYKPRVRERKLEITIQNKPKPFKDMTFAILGETVRKVTQLTSEILLSGGEITTTIDENLTACFSNLSITQMDPRNEQMKELEKLNIPVVLETLVDEAQREDTALTLIKKKNIRTWSKEPVLRIKKAANTSKSRKSSQLPNSKRQKFIHVKSSGVDPRSGLEDKAHIHEDKTGKRYSVILGGINIQLNKNDFYKIQILEITKASEYWLFRSWGRIGEDIGAYKLNLLDLEGCVDCFVDFYRDKSGNDWSTKNFQKKPNMKYPIGIDYGDHMVEELLKSTMKSRLNKPIQDLIEIIFNIDLMKQVILEFKIDLTIMPLGKLAENQIYEGYKVLGELLMLIKDRKTKSSEFVDGTNKFYTYIPHALQTKYPESLLDTKEKVESKMEMLKALLNLTFNYKLLNATTKNSTNPLDYEYDQLKVDLAVLAKNCDEFKLIEKYVEQSHGPTHREYRLEVEQVFVVKRHGEDQRFEKSKEFVNRKLLWHGTRITNIPSILSDGLKIDHPGISSTGAMCGQALYFADRVSKSARYCYTSGINQTPLLLLCEVALGVMDECYVGEYNEKLPVGSHSRVVWGRLKPNPEQDCMIEDGICVPLGESISANLTQTRDSLEYNEYIVYKIEQVRIKYLVKTKKIKL